MIGRRLVSTCHAPIVFDEGYLSRQLYPTSVVLPSIEDGSRQLHVDTFVGNIQVAAVIERVVNYGFLLIPTFTVQTAIAKANEKSIHPAFSFSRLGV